jgi:hypothetical protein
VLAVLNYYKHDAIEDVFNLIRRIYGEFTSGSQVGGRRMGSIVRMMHVLPECATE